ncbi:MAG: class I SAM-dependent methyltransferase [Treponema sp.]|jgi:tRNA (cmo5U34)-methyltransferase|nr:class I SAM-dependent methyltransferase [Treponema sp.]
MDRIETVKNHFEEEAKEFDEIILKLIPHYTEMIEALVLSIPFEKDKPINVIDLGCGTGTIGQKIKIAFPNSKISCLDIAENMIKMAQIKIGENIDYYINDFYDFDFDKKYDVIISSLALHHLANDEDKKMFYRKIYNALTDNGVFYNADVVLGSNSHIQDLYIKKWKTFMGKNVPLDEIENKWIVKYKTEDRPASLINHINWLKEIGYKNIDVVWKYYNYCVYGGYK